MKDILNVQLGDSVVSIGCEHEKDSHIYILDDEFIIKGWTIKKVIKHCNIGEWHVNYEYIIKDPKGCEKIKKYYYTGRSWHYKNECRLGGNESFSMEDALSYFIRNSPIFQCKDWKEYEAHRCRLDIQKLTEYNFNVRENLFKIKNIVEQFFAEN